MYMVGGYLPVARLRWYQENYKKQFVFTLKVGYIEHTKLLIVSVIQLTTPGLRKWVLNFFTDVVFPSLHNED